MASNRFHLSCHFSHKRGETNFFRRPLWRKSGSRTFLLIKAVEIMTLQEPAWEDTQQTKNRYYKHTTRIDLEYRRIVSKKRELIHIPFHVLSLLLAVRSQGNKKWMGNLKVVCSIVQDHVELARDPWTNISWSWSNDARRRERKTKVEPAAAATRARTKPYFLLFLFELLHHSP